MRRLVLSMFTSLDGYTEAPGGEFVGPAWSPDLDGWTRAMADRFDTLLYGYGAWRAMSEYWPHADPSDEGGEMASFMNETRKLVVSRQHTDVSAWANSRLAQGDLPDVVAAEKRRDAGGDIVVFAGARFAQTLMHHDLVDEYSILTLPELFGGGQRLFENHGLRRSLRLLESTAYDTGAVLSRYAVTREVPTA